MPRRSQFILVAALLAAGCASRSPDQLDPIAYYDKKDREEAQLQERKAAEAERAEGPTVNLFSIWGEKMNKSTPIELVRKMEDKTSAQSRWTAINQLVLRDFAQRPPYTTRYAEIAAGNPELGTRGDPDYLVRAVAIRALNRSRDASATATFIRALNDPSELVRLEAVKALNNLPNADAGPPLVALLSSETETMDVRIAAAEALRHYKRIEVARALVTALGDRDFGIAWQAHRSLHRMMRTSFGYDQGGWLAYFTGPTKPFG